MKRRPLRLPKRPGLANKTGGKKKELCLSDNKAPNPFPNRWAPLGKSFEAGLVEAGVSHTGSKVIPKARSP